MPTKLPTIYEKESEFLVCTKIQNKSREANHVAKRRMIAKTVSSHE